jgi:hypothetical protein
VPTARGRAILALVSLGALLAVAACSRSGGEAASAPSSPEAQPAPSPSPSAPEANAQNEPTPAAPSPALDAPELRPESATGAVKGIPAPTNTAPIVAVGNYFTELAGVDIAGLKPGQKEKFLQRINSEICSCGCKNDTLARCYVNDPRCPLVKSLVQKVYDEVKTGK